MDLTGHIETLIFRGQITVGNPVTVTYDVIDHNQLLNRGVNTHAQIDIHLSDNDIHIINNTIDGGLFQP